MDIKQEKNFKRWCKRNISYELTDREKELLMLLWEYFSNRVKAYENRIHHLELRSKNILMKFEPNNSWQWSNQIWNELLYPYKSKKYKSKVKNHKGVK